MFPLSLFPYLLCVFWAYPYLIHSIRHYLDDIKISIMKAMHSQLNKQNKDDKEEEG